MKTPNRLAGLSLAEMKDVERSNNVRLNSAIGYITPKDMLAGCQQEIQAEQNQKLKASSEQRKNRRQRAA